MREDIQAIHRDLAQVMDSVLAEVFPNPNGKMPRGWGWRRLGDIAPEDSQQIFPTDYPGHLFNYWGLDATEKGQIDEPAPNFVAGSSIKSACIKFTSEHVLYCKLRPYLNKVIVPSLEGIGSTEWVPLRPDPEIIERKFLAFALRTPQFVQYATSNVAGARMPRMSKRALEETKIPIPYLDDPARSLAEQRRIVARLELLLGETRAMREDIQAIHRDLAQVMDSVLAEVFPNPNGKMPRGWGWKSIDDLFELQQGASMSPRRRQGRNPQPFLRTKNILWGEVDTSDVDVMDFTEDEIERLKLRKGDLLICEGGDVGRAAVWEDQLPLVMYQNHIHRLRRKSEDIDPKFYVYWMKAAYQLFKIYQGEESRTAIPNLSGRRLKNFLVPTTSLTEQHCIVACLEHIAEEIRAMDDRLEQDLRDIEALDQSILAAAFRGEV
jgi:type I restriction enzyme S subunit